MPTARQRSLKEKQLQILLKKHKIRDCYISLVRKFTKDNYDFERELLKKHGIRECKVVVDKYVPKKKLVSSSKKNISVRFNVPWLPKIPTLERGSKKTLVTTAALNKDFNTPKATGKKSPQQEKFTPNAIKRRRALSMYDDRSTNMDENSSNSAADLSQELLAKRNSLKPLSERSLPSHSSVPFLFNPVKCHRVNSMLVERAIMQLPHSMPTMDDLHAELLAKRNNLKPASERQLGPVNLDIQLTPQWKLIQEEFNFKLAAN